MKYLRQNSADIPILFVCVPPLPPNYSEDLPEYEQHNILCSLGILPSPTSTSKSDHQHRDSLSRRQHHKESSKRETIQQKSSEHNSSDNVSSNNNNSDKQESKTTTDSGASPSTNPSSTTNTTNTLSSNQGKNMANTSKNIGAIFKILCDQLGKFLSKKFIKLSVLISNYIISSFYIFRKSYYFLSQKNVLVLFNTFAIIILLSLFYMLFA